MFEAFAIGIRLRLLDSVTGGLVSMAGQFSAFNRHVDGSKANLAQLEEKLKRIKMMGIVGGAMMGAGVAGLAMFKAPLEEAAKFDQQVAKFKLFGLGDAVNSEATKFAKGMNIIGTSYTDAMRHMNEAQGVFRESGLSGSAALAGAKLAAPLLSKIDFATESLDDESRARMRTSSLAMLRFVELRGGLNSPGAFSNIADAGWKAIQTSGGNINWEQLRQFMARGGVAAQGLNNTALFGELEPVIGEMKGSTAGNALMTAYNRLVGGVRIPNQIAHLLAENGIWDPSKVIWNSQGGIKAFKGNPLRDFSTFSQDPMQFYQRDILPMYAKMHLDTPQDRARENTLLFGRTGGAFFSLIDRQQAIAARSVAAQAKAMGVDASVNVAAQTPQGKLNDLTAKWKNLLVELGNTVMPAVIKGVEGLTSGLKIAVDFMHQFPALSKGIIIGFAILAGLVAVGGAITLATAGFIALSMSLGLGKTGLGAKLLEAAIGLKAIGAAIPEAAVGAGPKGASKAATAARVAGQAFFWTAVYESIDTAWNGKLGSIDFNSWSALSSSFKGAMGAQSTSATRGQGGVSPYIAAPAGQPIHITVPVKLDSKTIAAPVAKVIAKAAAAPQTGISGFDGSLSPAPAGGIGGY